MQAYEGGATKRRKYLKKERKLKVRGNVKKKKKDFVLSIAPSGKKKSHSFPFFFNFKFSAKHVFAQNTYPKKKKR